MTEQRHVYGTGTVLEDKKRGGFVGVVELPRTADGRRRRRWLRGQTREEVLARMDAERTRRREGKPPSSSRSQMTVQSWITHWLNEIIIHCVAPSSLRAYRERLAHVIEHLGPRRLRSVTEEDLEKLWHTLAREGLAPGTITAIRTAVGSCFKEAYRRGHIDRNPAMFAKGPRKPGPRLDGMVEEQAMEVLKAARGDRLEAAAAVLLHLGLRNSELCGLRWDDVDLESKPPTLVVMRSKTRAGLRMLELSPELADILRAHLHRQRKEKMAAPIWANVEGRIFTQSDGRPLSERELLRWWHELTIAAGVGRRRVHAARHSAATILLDNDTALETVSQMLGHARLSITVDTYGGRARRRTGTAVATMARVLSDKEVS